MGIHIEWVGSYRVPHLRAPSNPQAERLTMIENNDAGDTRERRPMNEPGRTISKAEAARVLRRCGFPTRVSVPLLADLPDPIDLDRIDPEVVARYGLTAEELMDRLGASP